MGVFSELKPVNHARKNPFDLSCYSTYNTKVGMVLPLQSWPTLPSSKYKFNLKALMRTQPLHTAAFAGFSINYDVVWSPYNDHYSSFNQFVAQRLNKQHTTQPGINNIPSFKLKNFLDYLIPFCVADSFLSELSFYEIETIYNDPDYEIGIPEYTFRSLNFPSESVVLGCIRNLDLLGYGNFLPYVKQMVNSFKRFLDDDVTYGWNVTYTSQDPEREALDKKLPYIYRFLSYFDSSIRETGSKKLKSLKSFYPDLWGDLITKFWDVVDSLEKYGVYRINISDSLYSFWNVMTYNKVWWQFYRNEYYDEDFKLQFSISRDDSEVYTIPYVNLFNYDDFVGPIEFGDGIEIRRFLSMFAVKPHQYKKDLFTGLLPSTQFGSVSVATSQDAFAKLISNSLNSTVLISKDTVYSESSGNVRKAVSDITTAVSGNRFKFDPAPAIEVLELRRADALQRFKERMLRAGNRTKDIFKAHGWDEPYSEKAFEAEFLGTFDGRLDLNVVTSTTDTDKVNLGQLAANGIGVIGGDSITFESHDFGTLMVVAYITKDAIYDAYGVDSVHTKLEPFDFPYPELQNVSLAPITEGRLEIVKNNPNTVLGYLPQNMTYKTAVDKVHGEFFAVDFFSASNESVTEYQPVSGIFSNMVTPRLDIFNAGALDFLYIQPDCADNIFVVNANWLQESDQFFANVHFDLKAVQPLDVIGLPI